MITSRRIAGAAALIVLLPLAVSACAAPGSDGESVSSRIVAVAQAAKDEGRDDVYALMKDGKVTRAEHLTAFANLSKCIHDAGQTISDPVLSPADGLSLIYDIDANGQNPTTASEAAQKCEDDHWGEVTAYYVASHTQRMTDPVRKYAIACMKKRGFDVSGNETSFPDLAGDAPDDGRRQDAAVCVQDGVYANYPDIRHVGVSM